MSDTSSSQPQLSAVPASEEHRPNPMATTGVHPVTNVEVKTAISLGVIKLVVAGIAVVFLGGWGAFAAVAATSKSAVDAGIAPYEEKLKATNENVQALADSLRAHIEAEQERLASERAQREEDRTAQKETRAEVREMRADMRKVFPTLPALKDAGPIP